jgi:hypothetical protein
MIITLTVACNLPGYVAERTIDNVQDKVEEQLQDALEATGAEELTEDLKGIAEEFSGQDIGELMDNFSVENWEREDIPLPPDAEIISGYSGDETQGEFVLLETSMDIDEVADWMVEQLEAKGWVQGEMEFQMDLARMYDFSKGDENLGLVLNDNILGEGTNISITVYR